MRSVTVALTATTVLLAMTCAVAADLPTWQMAELNDESLSGWDRPVRVVPAGKLATFTVPAWWGESFRPLEGVVYVLKISYKDTATQPVVFYSHGGVGSYWGLSEVHRFGGSGDGKWKVAEVPVSWDLLCRKNLLGEPTDVTEFGVYSNANLPVESIQVVLAEEGADEKYFRQSRAWIASAQAEKRKAAGRGEKQTPVLPESTKGRALVPYVRTYMSPVMQNAAPQRGETGRPLKFRMARNEYETAAFAVYANGQALKQVNFTISELTGPAGELDCQVALRTAEYSAVIGDRANKTYHMFPQRLWPAHPVDVAAGNSHWFWVTVHTLGNRSKPGRYTGTIDVTATVTRGLRTVTKLPVEVEVVPVTLLTMQQAGLELGACGRPTLQELKTLAEYNHTGMDIWFGGTQQQMQVVDGKLVMDHTYLDDWMAYASKLGMTHMMWFMGGDPYGFPDTLNLERDLYRAQEGDRNALRREFLDKTNARPERVIPELRDLYVQWVRQTAEHAKKNNWPKLIIHPFDEPAKWVQSRKWDNPFHNVIGTGKWINGHFKDCCALIRQGAKGYDNILVGGDMHHAVPSMTFVKDVDVFCTNAIHEDLQLGEKVRAAGTQFWQYSGCGDQSPPHQPRFTFGWYFAAFDSRGSLVWAYDAMGRFDTSEGSHWGYGWYTPFGVVETPFMIGLREGWDDRRWIETYKKQVVAKDPAAKKLLEEIGQEAIKRRTQRGRDTVSDFYAEMKRYEQMDVWRDRLIDSIVAATKR